MCSLKNLILGIQQVALQECSEVGSSGVFDTAFSSEASYLNIESVLDDIIDQVAKSLGPSWRQFLEFVASCDPSRSVYASKLEHTAPRIVSNDSLAVACDTIFVACFLRSPRGPAGQPGSNRLRAFYQDIEILGIEKPRIPPLRGAQNLQAWVKGQTMPTREDRAKVSHISVKALVKLAQLDAVLLAGAIEQYRYDIIAKPDEAKGILDDGETNNVVADPHTRAAEALMEQPAAATQGSGSAITSPGGQNAALPPGAVPVMAPDTTTLDCTGGTVDADNKGGPPAARAIMVEKPLCTIPLFKLAVAVVHHHQTFPAGLRQRLCSVLLEEFGLTLEQRSSLMVSATENSEGRRLQEDQLYSIRQKEKDRLVRYQSVAHKDTKFLLLSSLVPDPNSKGRHAKYMTPPNWPAARSTGTRSLPDFNSTQSRRPWAVPKSTGPLTMDPELKKLRSNGFFIKAPALR
jgi:hypothetical protein